MKLVSLSELSSDRQKLFLDSFDTVLSDCDGVLWLGSKLIPGANRVINALKSQGKRVYYVTNNSSKTQAQFFDKLISLGFNAEREEIICTAYLAAQYIKKHLTPGKKVYLIGESSIADELKAVGIESFGVGPDPMPTDTDLKYNAETMKLDPDVGAVVVGFDYHISYPKIMKAASYLTNPEVLFVSTNTDGSVPIGSTILKPGPNTMVNAVQTSAQREPFVIGKPSKLMGSFLMENHNINPSRTLMIGDRGTTDIRLGYNNGFQTLLVLTGCTSMDEAIHWSKSSDEEYFSMAADYYLQSLGDLELLLA